MSDQNIELKEAKQSLTDSIAKLSLNKIEKSESEDSEVLQSDKEDV